MPEDLPEAVMVLSWLLIGLIVIGYLIMAYAMGYSILFAIIYYGLPIYLYRSRKKKVPSDPER
ncbi:MAG: hypothetical protein ACC641_06525 [Acidiferrobacterales bacterium]